MYEFTRATPPLLRDFPDPRSVPLENLQQHIGEATWQDVTKVTLSGWNIYQREITKDYAAERSYRWLITTAPEHYAEDLEYEVVHFEGYKKTQKEAFEQTVGIEIKAGLSKSFSATVKASLKFTAEESQEWREEVTTRKKMTFRANTTYVGWELFDTIRVRRTSVERTYFQGDRSRLVSQGAPVVSESFINCSIGRYQDKLLIPPSGASNDLFQPWTLDPEGVDRRALEPVSPGIFLKLRSFMIGSNR